MSTNHESDTDELDGRTKLLSSRPEPDNILVFGIATLIGLFFCFVAFYFVISEMIEIGWHGLDGFWPFFGRFYTFSFRHSLFVVSLFLTRSWY